MLTIFIASKPFSGHIDIIQQNAIRSWLSLRPECEIILFGGEKGTATRLSETFYSLGLFVLQPELGEDG